MSTESTSTRSVNLGRLGVALAIVVVPLVIRAVNNNVQHDTSPITAPRPRPDAPSPTINVLSQAPPLSSLLRSTAPSPTPIVSTTPLELQPSLCSPTSCGTDWSDANSKCGTSCAFNEDACAPSGESCFTDLSMTLSCCFGGFGGGRRASSMVTTPLELQAATSTTSLASGSEACPAFGDALLPSPGCASYYACLDGSIVGDLRYCPFGYLFDVDSGSCKDAENVTCLVF